MLTTLDLGHQNIGVACWGDSGSSYGDLFGAYLCPTGNPPRTRGPETWVRAARALEEAGRPSTVVMETMKVYQHETSIDPGDLLQLQGIAGAVSMLWPAARVEGVEAWAWKGQVPKRVLLARLQREMHKRGWEERIRHPTQEALAHNIYDAVGIGLWWFERGPGRRS